MTVTNLNNLLDELGTDFIIWINLVAIIVNFICIFYGPFPVVSTIGMFISMGAFKIRTNTIFTRMKDYEKIIDQDTPGHVYVKRQVIATPEVKKASCTVRD